MYPVIHMYSWWVNPHPLQDYHTLYSCIGPMLLWPACWKTAWSVEETTIDGRVRVV